MRLGDLMLLFMYRFVVFIYVFCCLRVCLCAVLLIRGCRLCFVDSNFVVYAFRLFNAFVDVPFCVCLFTDCCLCILII